MNLSFHRRDLWNDNHRMAIQEGADAVVTLIATLENLEKVEKERDKAWAKVALWEKYHLPR